MSAGEAFRVSVSTQVTCSVPFAGTTGTRHSELFPKSVKRSLIDFYFIGEGQ